MTPLMASKTRRKLFGTDGVRGKANVYPMTTEVAMRLGQALALHVRSGPRRHRVVIGKDTRLSGYMLEQALAAGVCSMGVDVMLCGPLPTPGIAFLTRSMRADAGAVISASHNPYQDNGIKLFGGDGFKLDDELEAKIEAYVLGATDAYGAGEGRPTETRVGKAYRVDDAIGRYVVHLKERFPQALTLDGVTLVLDCAHGAAYRTAPAVFEELGAKVVALGVKPDGRNINRRAGALHPEAAARAVLRHGAQVGFALDGDADRLVAVDERGQVVDGDALLAALGGFLQRRGELKGGVLVSTIMSNLGLDHAMRALGAEVERTAVGDRHVVQRMREGGFSFGGEQSGHLVFLEHATTGDGTLAALMVLQMMAETGRPLSELAAAMTPYPQAQRAVQVRSKPPLEELGPLQAQLREIEAGLNGAGRVLVRYSGTEAKVRVLVEGPDSAGAEAAADALAATLSAALA